ncbi:MAG: hypothetical protein JXA73_03335 [Acidobacteria bacterium]|nr:hypothetical protein [Acidobacteriota bacterium]
MKLVCIGVGGSGAASLELVLHLAAIGLFPSDCMIVPMALDPDRGHPRITGMVNFLKRYTDCRKAGNAADETSNELFGCRLEYNQLLNSSKPSDFENLFRVFRLSDFSRQALMRVFFRDDELGKADSTEFANGYYGRANAGVCFFCEPQGREALLKNLRGHLLDGDSRVVIMGSSFGGTGTAGMVHVARSIREDEKLKHVPVQIAVVQLEPYFEPDPSKAPMEQGFINMPQTFQRRTGASYRFLYKLAANDNLPFNVLYPLGVPKPTVFPPEWFKRDSQDNPHLWVEYLSAMAARDFVLNKPHSGSVCLRRIPFSSFGEPINELRRRLYAAASLYSILRDFAIPLVKCSGDSTRLPGHPWLHDVLVEGALKKADLVKQLDDAFSLLHEILGHAGVLSWKWRSTMKIEEDVPSSDISDRDHTKYEGMTRLTKMSFPDNFLPLDERISNPDLLKNARPENMFSSYNRSCDAKLPVRGLFRWILDGLTIPIPKSEPPVAFAHQLVQQEDILDRSGQKLNLPQPSDDSFWQCPAKDVLKILERATWKSPPHLIKPQTTEYPSVWAPVIIHGDQLYSKDGSEEALERRAVHLGLLYLATMPCYGLTEVPIFCFPLSNEAIRAVIHLTFPMPSYESIFLNDTQVLALYMRDNPVIGNQVPEPDDIVGVFYPDTVVVPAAGMTKEKGSALRALGQYAEKRGFPAMLLQICASWADVLDSAGIPDGDVKGRNFVDYLKSFPPTTTAVDGVLEDRRYTSFPLTPVPPWIEPLYRKKGKK